MVKLRKLVYLVEDLILNQKKFSNGLKPKSVPIFS